MSEEKEELYQKPPSMFQMLKSFSTEALKHIANKGRNVSSEDYAERLDACNSCKHLIKKHMRCGLCGCLVQFKAKWETTTCPDSPSRWKRQIISDSEEK
tara:strand:- start:3341 stop:3637 length:297 start_codon:yes stop_codon:yes gene_type:complete